MLTVWTEYVTDWMKNVQSLTLKFLETVQSIIQCSLPVSQLQITMDSIISPYSKIIPTGQISVD